MEHCVWNPQKTNTGKRRKESTFTKTRDKSIKAADYQNK